MLLQCDDFIEKRSRIQPSLLHSSPSIRMPPRALVAFGRARRRDDVIVHLEGQAHQGSHSGAIAGKFVFRLHHISCIESTSRLVIGMSLLQAIEDKRRCSGTRLHEVLDTQHISSS